MTNIGPGVVGLIPDLPGIADKECPLAETRFGDWRVWEAKMLEPKQATAKRLPTGNRRTVGACHRSDQ